MLSKDNQLGLWMSDEQKVLVDALLRRARERNQGCLVHVARGMVTKVEYHRKMRAAVQAEGAVRDRSD